MVLVERKTVSSMALTVFEVSSSLALAEHEAVMSLNKTRKVKMTDSWPSACKDVLIVLQSCVRCSQGSVRMSRVGVCIALTNIASNASSISSFDDGIETIPGSKM